MKLPVRIAKILVQLSNGESISSSKAKHISIEELIKEKIIDRTGRIQKKLYLINKQSLSIYLKNNYGISDLEKYIEVSNKENVSRNELTAISSDSKLKKVRTFKGFLVNSYIPVEANLNNKPIILSFTDGIFKFIYDFENFLPHKDFTIIGIENPENFRCIEKQKHLFEDIKPLFVSRYPQNQSKDLIKWLQSIPNNYLHFGDFDLAGIGIYLNEFEKHLSNKSTFFIPKNIEILIEKHGNRERYDNQKINFKEEKIKQQNITLLIKFIHKYKKGLDQEILITKS